MRTYNLKEIESVKDKAFLKERFQQNENASVSLKV